MMVCAIRKKKSVRTEMENRGTWVHDRQIERGREREREREREGAREREKGRETGSE